MYIHIYTYIYIYVCIYIYIYIYIYINICVKKTDILLQQQKVSLTIKMNLRHGVEGKKDFFKQEIC